MRKKRASKAPKAKRTPKTKGPSENEIQMHCWAWVKKAHPELLIFHVANELKAHVSYHLKQKRLGKLNGVADFLAFPTGGRKFAIEMKDGKGEQDADQIRFQKRWEAAGGLYYVVRTLGSFQDIIGGMMLFGGWFHAEPLCPISGLPERIFSGSDDD